MNQHTSFVSLSLADWEEYTADLLDRQQTGAQRREVISYLKHVHQNDEAVVKKTVADHRARHKKITKHLLALSHTNISPMFNTAALTTTEIMNKLQENNSSVFIRGYTFADQFDVTGAKVQIYGESNGLSAVDQKLVCSAIVNKTIKISAADCVVHGVQFNSTNNEYCVEFGIGAENVTFKNCKFIGDGSSLTRWFYGENFKGSIHLENCWVQGYGSWMLGDGNTDSSDPTGSGRYLTDVTVKNCLFRECAGSLAFRGAIGNPGGSCLIEGNKFDYGGTQHALFWSAIEANNFQTVVCKNNVADGAILGGTVRGFFQTWSKHAAFDLTIQDNSARGFDVAYQIAMGNPGSAAIHYGCNAGSVVKSDADDEYTGTTNFASVIYEWDGSDSPTQQVIGGVLPTFNTSLNIVTTQSEWL